MAKPTRAGIPALAPRVASIGLPRVPLDGVVVEHDVERPGSGIRPVDEQDLEGIENARVAVVAPDPGPGHPEGRPPIRDTVSVGDDVSLARIHVGEERGDDRHAETT